MKCMAVPCEFEASRDSLRIGPANASPLCLDVSGTRILHVRSCAIMLAIVSSSDSPTGGYAPMGFKQTATHKNGKGSFHQIGLVRGQFGNVPEADWLKFIQGAGFDGWEEASWELDLDEFEPI